MSKRKALSLSEKINLFKDADNGMKNKEVSRKYKIAPSSVSTILKNRDSIIKLYETSGDFKKRSRGCKYDDVDESVLQWVIMVQGKNVPLSGPVIKEKAAEYAKTLGHKDFQASSGWLDKFKKRHRIKEKVIRGERESVNKADITEWKDTDLKTILEDYEPNNIFSADETGIFFKSLPNKTLSFKGDKCFDGKKGTKRVTVMVGTNMAGTEKLKLLVIGKSKSPRCFKGVKTLEVDYDFNKNSWMTSNIFEKWIVSLDEKMRKQNRNIAMIVNKCSAHPPCVECKLNNIKLLFFPPNVTSILQPMNQGVIQNLKVHYRKRIMRRFITVLETNQSLTNVINLRTSLTELAKVWQNDVTEITIKNCFAKAGFVKLPDRDDIDDQNDEELVQIVVKKFWDELKGRGVVPEKVSLEDFLNIDNGLAITEPPTDKCILNSLQKEDEEDNEMEEDEDENHVKKPSQQSILAAFDTLRHGFQAEENVPDEIFQCLNKCEHFFEELSVKRLVQGDIKEFFI